MSEGYNKHGPLEVKHVTNQLIRLNRATEEVQLAELLKSATFHIEDIERHAFSVGCLTMLDCITIYHSQTLCKISLVD
jgi:hypothetical protein